MARMPRATFLLFLVLAALASCGYFDPLNPPDPDPADKSITWQTYLGELGCVARCVQETSDGGFVFVGTKEWGTAEADLWMVKTDGQGQEQWSRSFGGTAEDTGSCLRSTSDGGYILLGSTRSSGDGDWDVYLVKTDAAGVLEWESNFGGNADDQGWSVECIAGGYIIVGSTASSGEGNNDLYLLKADRDGNSAWEKTFGGPYSDVGYAVRQACDGGFILAGYTQASFDGDDNAWLVKTKADGELEWDKVFGIIATSLEDIPHCLEQAKDVQLTLDGGYLLAAYTHSLGAGDFDAWLVKTDASGNEEWNQTFGGGAMDQAEAMVRAADGGYALAGVTRSHSGWNQAWLVKMDAAGEAEWDKDFGGIGDECGYCLQQTFDGGYILAGSTTSYGGSAYLVYYKPWSEGP
jgi:hypothetical protein